MSLRDSLSELARWGSPVDLAVAETQSDVSGLEIDQVGDSHILELENRRVGYLLDVCITNLTSSAMYVADLELRVPWDQRIFEWLVPQTISGRNLKSQRPYSYEQYKFPGKSGFDLPIDEVINTELTFGKRLLQRSPLSGWLLATGGPMPCDLFHGGMVDLTIVLTTTDHAEYSGTIQAWTERLVHNRRQPEKRESGMHRGLLPERVKAHQWHPRVERPMPRASTIRHASSSDKTRGTVRSQGSVSELRT